jgi:hypothetical protein
MTPVKTFRYWPDGAKLTHARTVTIVARDQLGDGLTVQDTNTGEQWHTCYCALLSH